MSHVAADATRPKTIEDALAQAARERGPIDILIYNVRDRFTMCEPLAMTCDDLEQSLRLEVVGAFAAARTVLPAMRKRGSGTILYSSATAAFRGSAVVPLYAIGKFDLRRLAQSLAKVYAADGVHIAHRRLDCDLDMPLMREMYGDACEPGVLADPAAVAET